MNPLAPILKIESAGLRITLSGPVASPKHPAAAGALRITSDEDVQVWTAMGNDLGLGLWEQTDYHIVVEPRNGQPARVSSRSPSVTSGLASIGDTSILAGRLNLASSIGMLSLDFAAGEARIQLVIEVFPSKIDYLTDYRDLLTDVGRHHRHLLLRYLGETERATSSVEGESSTDIEWATILRNEVETIADGLRLAAQRPLSNFVGQIDHVAVSRIRRVSGATVSAIARQSGRGSWIEVQGKPVRERLPVSSRMASSDTPEHRWLQGQLQLVQTELLRIISELRRGDYAPGERHMGVSAAIRSELDAMYSTVAEVRRSDLLKNSMPSGSMIRPTTALMTRVGYAQAFRSLSILRHSLAVFGDQLSSSVGRLATLYEQWCFLEVVDIVADAVGASYSRLSYIAVTQQLLSNGLSNSRPVVLDNGVNRIQIEYNREFDTTTGKQRPDIVITADKAGDDSFTYVLDAKYRLTRGARESRFDTPGTDAIDAMHRYRDAITVPHAAGHRRIVRQAVALFPGGESETMDYEESPLFRSIASVGVGAIPFLPSNRTLVLAWLRDSLVRDGIIESPLDNQGS